MIASELISSQLFPLKPTDVCLYAKEMFQVYRISELPVVENKQLLGVVSTKDLIDAEDDERIADYLNGSEAPRIEPGRHLLDIIRVFGNFQLSTLAVVDKSGEFFGIIALSDIVKHLGDSLTLRQEGCIVSVKMSAQRYSLNEFSRIAESENIRIIGLVIHQVGDTDEIVASFKLNSLFPDAFASACERLGYQIFGTYSLEMNNSDVRERYEALMKYLDL